MIAAGARGGMRWGICSQGPWRVDKQTWTETNDRGTTIAHLLEELLR